MKREFRLSETGDNFGDAKVYYSNCRLGGVTALLAGPFLTAPEAEATLDIVGPIAIAEQPETKRATFGVVQMRAPGDGPGKYNSLLPPHMQGTIGIGVRLS